MSLRRVLIVNYEYPPLGGGGGVFTRDLAEALAGDVEVTVLTSRTNGLPARANENGVQLVRVPVLMRTSQATATLASLLSFFPASFLRGRELLAEERFDLVHSFFAVPSACSGALLARRAGVPHVVSILGGDIYDPTKRMSPHRTPLLRGTVRGVLRGADRVVALSSDIQRRAIELYGIEREIELVPLGIPEVRFQPQPRSSFGLAESDVVIVTVGRLVPRKGLHELLEIVAGLERPEIKLIVIGTGPERERLESLARRLGLAERVRLMGFVSDELKWQILHAADVYASTAVHEGFGIVFLEALSSGLPIVCYDEGGQVDFLESGRTALVVPLGDRDGFHAGLRRLCEDDELRDGMGANGREAARDYRIERCAERYRGFYDELIDRSAASGA